MGNWMIFVSPCSFKISWWIMWKLTYISLKEKIVHVLQLQLPSFLVPEISRAYTGMSTQLLKSVYSRQTYLQCEQLKPEQILTKRNLIWKSLFLSEVNTPTWKHLLFSHAKQKKLIYMTLTSYIYPSKERVNQLSIHLLTDTLSQWFKCRLKKEKATHINHWNKTVSEITYSFMNPFSLCRRLHNEAHWWN